MSFVKTMPVKVLKFFQVRSQNNECDLSSKTIYDDLTIDEILLL